MNYTFIILVTYAVIMLLGTMLMTKKENNIEKFCIGDRNIGWLMSALSIAATWIWAPALFTSTENAYTKGFAGLFWFLVPNVLCLILFIPFAKKIRAEVPNGITLSGYMYQKYNSKPVKGAYLFQLGALSALSTGVQLLAGSKILSMLTGIPFMAMTVIMAVIAFSYSQFSGIKASILTDAVQMVFMLAASIGFVVFGVKNGGGLKVLINGLGGVTGDARSLFSKRGWKIFLGFGLPTTVGLISGPFGDQCFWQRAFCVRKDRLGRAFLVGALLFGIVPLSMGILGFIGAGMGYAATDTGVINFELISTLFPAKAIIPFLFMIVSGLLSTIDSNLCAVSSLATDIFKENTLIAMGKETADVYRYENLTENQKKKLMIADNKIFSLGIENLDTLNSFLEELQGDLDIPGFDEEILKQMVSNAEDITEKISQYGTLDDEEIQNIKNSAIKNEQKIQQVKEGQSKEQQEKPSLQFQQEQPAEDNKITDSKKFIICPNCGEKVWL